jgi:hypothetical protein
MLEKRNKFSWRKVFIRRLFKTLLSPTSSSMNKKCPNCSLSNFITQQYCIRCNEELQNIEVGNLPRTELKKTGPGFVRRAIVCFGVICLVMFGFYLSLIGTATQLSYDERKTVERAVAIIEEKGFGKEAFLLKHVTVYRRDDHWLNASVEKDTAYAATNFPFEIVTVYPEFFKLPKDDIERASILLHEAQHLLGADEHDAYAFAWKNRDKLGYSHKLYGGSEIYNKVGEQTKENAPEIFTCPQNEYGDCTR